VFGVLGPVRARAGESEVAITARRERTLLAALLLQPNRVVPLDQLVDAIWPAKPPRDPRGHVQGCVHRLRQLLASAGIPGEVIVTGQGGYRAVLHPEQLDLLEFRRLVAEARAASGAGRPDQAAGRYHAALALWRGPALSDVDSHLVRQAAAALDEERLQVLEERIRADLDAGAAGELVGELTGLIRQHPHREGLHGALMLALYRSGRQADALAAYRHARDLIRDELGSEPGPELQKLHQAILRHDPALVASPPRRPKPAGREAPVPRELPADVAGFTGRTGALKALDEMSSASSDIAAGPVVISAIAGTAGVGKTAVAVHWAHRVADRFPDGQPYLNLRGYSSGEPMRAVEALAALLRSLGTLPERIPTEEDQAAALYRTVMADRRVLVVLDNARSVDQVRPLLPGSHGCLVLVTSRDRLAGLVARNGARQLSLDVLPPEEAFALLTRILGADRTAAEPAATAELARVCAYLPLALRIAAAHLSDRTDLVIAAYIAELADSDPVTSLRVDGDDETAVRTALDRSYLSLPEPTRRMFRLLGVVPGPDFTAMAAAALAGSTVNDAAQHLRNLARAHLIDEYTPGRYTFHDLLRVYARELAIAEKDCGHRTPVIERLLSYYLHSADSAVNTLYPERLSLPIPQVEPGVSAEVFGDRHGALTWLASEQANLVAAVVHAADHGPLPFSWLLAVCLRRYFFQNRHTIDWMLTANAALRAAAKCGVNEVNRARDVRERSVSGPAGVGV
jgi:DNA-binding SARP family transcriptional activator